MNAVRRCVAVFAIVMGSLLVATWIALFLLRAVDYGSTRTELVFLLAAESLTGVSLAAGGTATALGRRWGAPVLLVALGMLLYCAVFSVGVFAGRGNLAAAAWFILVSACTAAGSVWLVVDVARDARFTPVAPRPPSPSRRQSSAPLL